MVAEDAEEKTNEVPDTNEDTVVTPVAGLSNELGVENRWAERQDGQDHKTDVLATVLHWNNFTGSGEGNKLV